MEQEAEGTGHELADNTVVVSNRRARGHDTSGLHTRGARMNTRPLRAAQLTLTPVRDQERRARPNGLVYLVSVCVCVCV